MADEYEDDDSGGGYGGGYSGPAPLAVLGMGEQFTTPEALEYAKKILGKGRNIIHQSTEGVVLRVHCPNDFIE